MSVEAVYDFLSLSKRDAAVQERVAQAAKQQDPLQAVVSLASEHGFGFTREELQATLGGELSEKELEAVAGGYAPGEWFAEVYAEWFVPLATPQIKKG